MLIVMVGFGCLLAVKQLYQSCVLAPSVTRAVRESVMSDIMGKARPQPTALRIMLPWLALPLVFILGRNCASIFFRAGRRKRQIKRDIKAGLLLERLRQGCKESFSLYLRSFAQEEKLKRRKGVWWYVLREGNILGIDQETLDLTLSAEVRSSYPMITFGLPGELVGAGRLPVTDAEWQPLILMLMKHAKVIFIVPGTSKGVIWEMETLNRHYHEKTIHIMPPTKYYQGAMKDAEKHWYATRQALIPRGLFLPVYDWQGALFMLDGQGSVARSSSFEAPFGGNHVRELIRQIT